MIATVAAALAAVLTPPAGAVSFSQRDYTLPNVQFSGFALGDLDNRNGPDIVIPQHVSAQVSELLNNGDGTFGGAATKTAGCPGAYYRPLIGQFTGDANNDLILNCSGGTDFSLNPGDGMGGFGSATPIAAGTQYVGSIANVDGRQDLVYPTGAPNWRACFIALSDLAAGPNCDLDSTHVFTVPVAFATTDLFAPGTIPRDQVFGLTGSPKDLAVAAYDPQGVGGWSFSTRPIGNDHAQDIAAGDINGDGLGDVVIGFDGNPGFLSVFLSKPPTGGIDPGTQPTFAGNSIEIPDAGVLELADFNRDGKTDVIAAGTDVALHPQFAIMLGRGDGTFDPPARFGTGFDPNSTAWWLHIADLNADGKPDVVVVNGDEHAARVFLNTTPSPPPTGGGGPGGGGGNGGGGAAAGPVISHVFQSAKKWFLGSALAHITAKRKLPVGTTFRFTLSEAASVRFAFTQTVPGRRAGRRCVTPNRKNAHKRRCKRTLTRGTLRFAGHVGVNGVRFQGRISRSKKLKPGRYKLIITATDTAGRSSAPQPLTFTIVKK